MMKYTLEFNLEELMELRFLVKKKIEETMELIPQHGQPVEYWNNSLKILSELDEKLCKSYLGTMKNDKSETNDCILVTNEEGTMRSVWDVLNDVRARYEKPMETGTTIQLSEEKCDLPAGEDVQEFMHQVSWAMHSNDGSIKIFYPTNSSCVTIHGAEELWFFICRLLDCNQYRVAVFENRT